MINKKGSTWGTWFWIILFVIIITSVVRHSYYRQAMYNDLYKDQLQQQQQEDYHQQQRKEELQRQYEQEQYEEMLREEQRQAYEEELRRQLYEEELREQERRNQYTEELRRQLYEEELREQERRNQYTEELRRQQLEDYYQEIYQYQSTPKTTTIKCTDSDGGKDYYTKGYITHSDGTKEYDECSTGAYRDYVWEHYCTTSGTGTLDYKCPYGCSDGKCNSEPQTVAVIVSYVSDGDTFKLSNGETVRLIGLNAPESGQSCSSGATAKLKEFVLGKEVTLEQDVSDKDQYGRLLRYVYVDDIFVNLEMVRLGLTHKYEYGSNTKYSSLFEEAENKAKQNEGCLWKTKEINYITDKCFMITNFHFNAAGNDNYNLNDEYVTLKNTCDYYINMDDWTIKDETASHIYYFPQFSVEGGNTVTLYTGEGVNTFDFNGHKLYWGRTSGNYAAIWNNNGDTLFLRDFGGNLVLTQSYSGY